MFLFCGIYISLCTSLALFPSYWHADSDESDSKCSSNKYVYFPNLLSCFDGLSVFSLNEPFPHYAVSTK